MIVLDLPFPPSVNHFQGQNGRYRFLSAKTKEFRAKVSDAVAELNLGTLTQELGVFLALYPPDKRKRDVDNYSKQVFDAIQHAGLIGDDYQFDKLVAVRHNPIKSGKCRVVLIESGRMNNLLEGLFNAIPA